MLKTMRLQTFNESTKVNKKTIEFCILTAIYAILVIDNICSMNTNCKRDVRVATIRDYYVTIDDIFATETTFPSRMIKLQSVQDPATVIVGYDRRACGYWDEIVMVSAGQTNIMSSAEYDRAFGLLNEMLDARMSSGVKWERINEPR